MRARVQAGGGAIMVLYFMFVTGVVLNTCRYVEIMFMMICKKYLCCIVIRFVALSCIFMTCFR